MKLHERLGLDPSHRAPAEAIGFRATIANANGPTAVSALAIGAAAIGALAIGRMAIGHLSVRGAYFKRLRVDELEVGRLTVGDGGSAPHPLESKLSHVDLVVSSMETSLGFYRDLLAPLGWTDIDLMEGERGETIHYLSVPGSGVSAIGLREATSDAHPVPYDRYAVGVQHVCIDVRSREIVDERAAWIESDGRGAILSAPAEHDYTPGYYAVFLTDPDGIKLELLHRPTYWQDGSP